MEKCVYTDGMEKNAIKDISIYVFSQDNLLSANVLAAMVEKFQVGMCCLNPDIGQMVDSQHGICVCLGVLPDNIEKVIMDYPIIRLAERGQAVNQKSTVLLTMPVRICDIVHEIANCVDIEKHALDTVLNIGSYSLNTKSRVLSGEELEDTQLTEKECAVIEYLYNKADETDVPVNREDLLHDVWHYVDGIDTHTIETHIYRLRQKVEKGSKNNKQNLILTVEGGYSLGF